MTCGQGPIGRFPSQCTDRDAILALVQEAQRAARRQARFATGGENPWECLEQRREPYQTMETMQ
eukprot:4297425-Amphidinium_carterae.1